MSILASYMPGAAEEALAARAQRLGMPLAVTMQLTDRCNYRCAHCYEVHDETDELSIDEIERVFDELAQAGVLFLTLTGGEPYLRRDLDAILAAARQRRFAVRLFTTGHFLDDARADRLAALAIQEVHLSLYGADAETHERVTLMPGSFERTVAAARRLRARGLTVVIKSPVMSVNIRKYRALVELVEELGCRYSIDPKLTSREDGERSPLHLRPSGDDIRWFYLDFADDETARRWAEQAAAYDMVARRSEGSCRIGQVACSVNPQGLVFGCVALPVPVGDLRKQSFLEVWRGSAVLERLRRLSWNDIEVCRDCTLQPYCSRCHAMALLEDGNMLGPSKEACRHAVAVRESLRARGLLPEGADTELPLPLRDEGAALRPARREKLAYGFRPAALRVIE